MQKKLLATARFSTHISSSSTRAHNVVCISGGKAYGDVFQQMGRSGVAAKAKITASCRVQISALISHTQPPAIIIYRNIKRRGRRLIARRRAKWLHRASASSRAQQHRWAAARERAARRRAAAAATIALLYLPAAENRARGAYRSTALERARRKKQWRRSAGVTAT